MFSVNEILEWTGGQVVNSADLESGLDQIRVDSISRLERSQNSHLAFFFSKSFQNELASAHPGVLITGDPFVKPLKAAGLPFWRKCAVISCTDPYYSMAVLSQKFAEDRSTVAHLKTLKNLETRVHPTAVVAASVELGPGVEIGPHCVLEEGVSIGARTVIYPGCTLGPNARVGEDCVLFPRVTLYEWTKVGNRVRLHSGVVLGGDGFGYAPKMVEGKVVGHQKIYHLGNVVIGDDVEIGANSTVDRGTFGETKIASQVKIDNLVQVGHNASVDTGAIICGGTCLAGNASVGKFAYVAGMVGIINHVHVGDGAKVGACSLVSRDIGPGETAVGNPIRDHRAHFRIHAMLNKSLAERRKK